MEAAVAKFLNGQDDDDFEAGCSDEEPSDSGGTADSSGSGGEAEPRGAASSSGEVGDDAEEKKEEEGWSDDGIDDDILASGSSGDEQEPEVGGQGEGGSGDEQEPEVGGQGEGGSGNDSEDGSGLLPAAGFLEGSKAASFAKAFAKILDTSGKKASDMAAGQGCASPPPILAASKSIAKRKAEQVEEQRVDRTAKKLWHEMKVRGHVVPKGHGQDPEVDQREKALQRLATKGVVRLFNAVAKAQKQLREVEEATGSRAKAVKLGKASFLAQLKHSSAAPGQQLEQPLVPSAPARQQASSRAVAAAPVVPAAGGRKQQQKQLQWQRATAADSSEDEDAGGWEVLQQSFVGLQGGNKMKDWDKVAASDEEGSAGEQLGGSSNEDN